MLSNNTSAADTFSDAYSRFSRLYARRAHLHHYAAFEVDAEAMFEEAANSVADLIDGYRAAAPR